MQEVTEERSKTMWCPHAKVYMVNGGHYNRIENGGDNIPQEACCIGILCPRFTYTNNPDGDRLYYCDDR